MLDPNIFSYVSWASIEFEKLDRTSILTFCPSMESVDCITKFEDRPGYVFPRSGIDAVE